jgi:pimeloyl-ACP methyl ester carboxylesterase
MADTSDEDSGRNEGFRDQLARVTVPPELDKEENRKRWKLEEQEHHEDDGAVEFFSSDPETLFENLSAPVNLSAITAGGGAPGVQGAAGFPGDLLDGVKAAARRIANYATYYQMKSRARVVGRTGLGLVLARARAARGDLPLHLVGHSLGGLVVTAAASTLEIESARVTMMLLQAAFSHNSFAVKFDGTHDGGFRTVLGDKRVSGPILITHTKNDKAVGIAYPLASRIAQHVASALGDENDPYGGLGRNGARHTPEAKGSEGILRPVGETYSFQRHRVFNLRADDFIKDHGDATGHQVAYAFLHGLGAA